MIPEKWVKEFARKEREAIETEKTRIREELASGKTVRELFEEHDRERLKRRLERALTAVVFVGISAMLVLVFLVMKCVVIGTPYSIGPR